MFINISFINHLSRLICFSLDYLIGRPHTNGAFNVKPVFIESKMFCEKLAHYIGVRTLREQTLRAVSKQLETIKHVLTLKV